MKIEDRRPGNNYAMFKDLEVGSVFEHVALNMIMIKLDLVADTNRNALRIDDADATLTQLWRVSPESMVIPVNAKLVIEE